MPLVDFRTEPLPDQPKTKTDPLELGKALVAGAREDPFVKPFVDGLAALGDVTPDQLDQMGRQLSGQTPVKVAKLIGEFAPSLLFGAGAYSLGKAGATALVHQVGKKIALDVGRETVAKMAAASGLRGQIGKLTVAALDEIGPGALRVSQTPGLQRAAEIIGANTALSGAVFAQEKARGKEDEEALRNTALALAFGAGLDSGLTVLGKALAPRSRSFFLNSVDEKFFQPGPKGRIPAASIEARLGQTRQRITKLNEQAQELLDVPAQERQLSLGLFSPSKLTKLPEDQRARVGEILRQKRLLHVEAKGLESILKTAGALPYTSMAPYTGGSFRWFLSKFTSSPEAFFGKGAAANRITTQLQRATDLSEALGRQHQVIYENLGEQARKALGLSQGRFRKGVEDPFFGEAVHLWETQGDDAARVWLRSQGRTAQQTEDFVSVMRQRSDIEYDVIVNQGRRIGGREAIPLDGSLGVVNYVSHSGLDLPEDELVRRMVSAGVPESEAVKVVGRNLQHIDAKVGAVTGSESAGTTRVGPLDFNRDQHGSLRDKFRRGMPVDPNPFNAGLRAVNGSYRRILLDPIVGSKGRNIDALTAAVAAEGGDPFKFRDLISALAGKRYYDDSMRRASKLMAGLQVTAKLPFAVFANATQSQNTLAWAGMKPFFQSAASLTRHSNREHLGQLLAIHHNVIRSLGRSFDDEGLVLGSMERAADATLKYSGFDVVERFNRMLAAGSAHFVIRDTVSKALRGRLRGNLLRERRMMLSDLGLDLDNIVGKAKLDAGYFSSQEYRTLEEIAVVRGAQRTQFFPGRTTRPIFWDHPIGRLAFQFKTFALGQARFLRDGILSEAANGNLRPLATLVALGPISGELVSDAKSIIRGRGRDDHGFDRVVDNLTYVGGFGIAGDFLAAAQRKNLADFLLGPTVSDLTGFAEAMLSFDIQQVISEVQRQQAFVGTLRLVEGAAYGADEVDHYLSQVSSEAELQGATPGQLLMDRLRRSKETGR